MDCPEFLARYSDYRDGLITSPRELRRFSRHLARCLPCRRHDAALRHGVLALRAADHLEPSPGFRTRLEERLRRERLLTESPVVPARGGVAAALFLAVALALMALETVGRGGSRTRPPELPAVARWMSYGERARAIVRSTGAARSDIETIAALTEENVLAQLDNLRTLPCVAAALRAGRLDLHGWVYDIAHGRFTAWDPTEGRWRPIDELAPRWGVEAASQPVGGTRS